MIMIQVANVTRFIALVAVVVSLACIATCSDAETNQLAKVACQKRLKKCEKIAAFMLMDFNLTSAEVWPNLSGPNKSSCVRSCPIKVSLPSRVVAPYS